MSKTQSPVQGGVSATFFTATIPLPPGINASYEVGSPHGKSQFFSSSESKVWKEEVAYILRNFSVDQAIFTAIKENKNKVPLELHIDFYFKTLWKKDADGGIKIVQDMVFKSIGLNDNLVKRLIVEKHADRNNPRCEIEVSLWEGREK